MIKSFIETIYGYKCNDCGISSYLGQKIVLQLEHRDGNALNNKKMYVYYVAIVILKPLLIKEKL